MSNRLYIPAHRRYVEQQVTEIEQSTFQMKNALGWYTSAPTDSNLSSIEASLAKVTRLVGLIRKAHESTVMSNEQVALKDPDKDV